MSFKFAKFYTRGWGNADVYRKVYEFQDLVRCKETLKSVIHGSTERTTVVVKEQKDSASVRSFIGEFISPATTVLPDTLPTESKRAVFQLILPKNKTWQGGKRQPVCVHIAGTGDHYFWRRRHFVATPLAKEHGIGSIILENPFYGLRKPKGQIRSALRHVSDTFVMGASLLLEVVTLLKWCEEQQFGPLGISGVSLGGYMTGVTSSGWPSPLVIVPCLSWTTAAPVFTEGVMCHNIAWQTLQSQLENDHSFTKLLSDYSSSLLPYRNLPQRTQTMEEGSTSRITTRETNEVDSRSSEEQPRTLNIGPISLELSIPAMLETLPAALYGAFQSRFNVDNLREATAFTDKDSISLASQETIDFMNMVMHKSTHMKEFNCPNPKSKVTFVVASHDRYVPWENVACRPQDYWDNIEFRYIDAGHVMSILQNHNIFRKAISDAFYDFDAKSDG